MVAIRMATVAVLATVMVATVSGQPGDVNLTNYYSFNKNYYQFIPCKLDGSSFDCKCASPYTNRHSREPDNSVSTPDWDPRDGDTQSESQDNFFWIVPSANCGFNQLQEPPGSETDNWPGQTRLRALYLFKNQIRDLTWTKSNEVRSQFDEMAVLEILNLRSNVLKIINVISFSDLAALVELNMEDNLLEALPGGIFDNNVALKFLRLGNNALTTLPAGQTQDGGGLFKTAVALKILHLENNLITSLPNDVFKTSTSAWLPNLREVYLTQNLLTQLTSGMFDGLALDSLYVQLNKISFVEGDFFKTTFKFTQSLLKAGPAHEQGRHPLAMAGNPSECFIRNNDYDQRYKDENIRRCFVSGGDPDQTFSDKGELLTTSTRSDAFSECADPNSTCFCDTGHENRFEGITGNSVAACEPVQCKTPPDFAAFNAVEDATSQCLSSKVYRDTCAAQCEDGYAGTSATYTCGADGEWVGSIECIPGNCKAEDTSVVGNYKLDCREKGASFGDECIAVCNVGFETDQTPLFQCKCQQGADDVTTVCEWTNTVEDFSCKAKACGDKIKSLVRETTPRDGVTLVKYLSNQNECVGNTDYTGDSCFVQCSAAQKVGGNPQVEYVCSDNGLWTPKDEVITCEGVKCEDAPVLVDGTVEARCRGDSSQFKDPCIVNCISGYKSSIHPKKPTGCNGRNGNKYGDECLECTAENQNGQDVGVWQKSELSCTKVECDKAMAEGSFEAAQMGSYVKLTDVDCKANLYGDKCTLGCQYGYDPKSESMDMACDANARGYGTWLRPGGSQEPVSCEVHDCGDLDTFISDADASVLTSDCSEEIGGVYYDPTLTDGTYCTNNNTWDTTSPATRQVRCDKNGAFEDEYTAVCTPEGWKVPNPSRSINFPSNICRKSCGSSIAPNTKGKGGVVLTDASTVSKEVAGNFKEVDCPNAGIGDSCNLTCNIREDTPEPYVFLCKAPISGTLGKWEQTSVDGEQDPASLCVSATVFSTQSNQDEGAVAAMIIVPLIVVIIVVIVLLYYFECLTCLGLQANKKRPKKPPMQSNPTYGVTDAVASTKETKKKGKKAALPKKTAEPSIPDFGSVNRQVSNDNKYQTAGFNVPMAM